MRRVRMLIGVATIAVGACSSSNSQSATKTTAPATTTIATTTTLPATTTTIDPTKQAAYSYLVIANTDNVFNEAAYNRFYGSNNQIAYSDLPAYCAAIDGADEVFARRLSAHAWPAAAKASVETMASDLAVQSGLEYQCAAAPGTVAGQQALNAQIQAAQTKVNNDASAVRVALGLPVKR